jgi:hypothetical protein
MSDVQRSFASYDEFGDYYAKVLSAPRYVNNGIRNARTGAEYAAALNTPTGTYYGTDSQSAYGQGVDRFRGQYQGSTISVGSIPVTITQPGASPDDIHKAVKSGVQAGIDAHVQGQMTQLGGAYQ